MLFRSGGQSGWTTSIWSLLGFYVLLTLASAFAGGALGFLFGLPKEATSASTDEPNPQAVTGGAKPAGAMPGHNTNLEQVSDWLTKVLLGAGLSQLSEAPHFLLRIGKRLAELFPGSSAAIIICVIIAYLVIGFGIFFLWAKLRLPILMTGRDGEQEEARAEVAEAKRQREQARAEAAEAKKQRDQALDHQQQDYLKRPPDQVVGEIVKNMETHGNNASNVANWQEKDVTPGNVPNDPWKGRFGNTSTADGYALSAAVLPIPGNDEFFKVTLTVQADTGKATLTDGEFVRIFIHDSYLEYKPVVPIKGGKAEIELISWGAFTVGVLANKGKTKLELDMAELESAPSRFRER